ncbi:hypothetical protein [Parerythrobacter aestuarii]|uniref:hypothetical protein n=1 Tax=Parerythrobacter aestuarii TaxID=3020909 RepID=UPI0024DEE5FA|nr:hypothetical protein [Parerythrobacter aestuarii]
MATTGIQSLSIAEMREFASFTACEQRYIRRSLDIGLGRCDAFKVWARNAEENIAIRSQYVAYQELKRLRDELAHVGPGDRIDGLIGTLIHVATFDLGQDKIEGFSAFRFLYERLLGAEVRPWLPSTFVAAAALPDIRPERRKILLQSLSEAAATAPGWSDQQPTFYPEFIEAEAA